MTQQSFKTVPILRIFDEQKAREFYVGFLGLKVDWEHRFAAGMPLYMQVSRGDLVLHLSEHHGDACPGSTVFIRATGLGDLHREITAKDYKFARPGLETAPWNAKARVMEVTDPFGNRLRFSEDLEGSPAAS
jgi:catechol 2,3-dioxygenase-like lactoylglutathione lyase family enzyme